MKLFHKILLPLNDCFPISSKSCTPKDLGAVVCTFANINDEKFVAENDMEECFCVLDVLRVLGKGQSHNNGIFLQNLTQPLMGPQLGYMKK